MNSAALSALDNIRGRRMDSQTASGDAPPSPESEKDRKIEELKAKLAEFKKLLDEE